MWPSRTSSWHQIQPQESTLLPLGVGKTFQHRQMSRMGLQNKFIFPYPWPSFKNRYPSKLPICDMKELFDSADKTEDSQFSLGFRLTMNNLNTTLAYNNWEVYEKICYLHKIKIVFHLQTVMWISFPLESNTEMTRTKEEFGGRFFYQVQRKWLVDWFVSLISQMIDVI